ncbi:cytochrome p450 [Fusarium phyllophilum]|uniref:Cytochrome p450 n=1 Tax=Fusarium phyllophilum TaxID=47803 RepID=A0A8H5JI90_9HYPO|nr:cytochrome p450 [Fusarium phyllophilum]
MSEIAVTPGENATIGAAGTDGPVFAPNQHILVRVVGACLAAYVAWQYLLRIGALWDSQSEPPMLPYWLPGIGHNISFFTDAEKLLVAARSCFRMPAQPFSVLIGGRRTYVILDPHDIVQTHQKTKELHFDSYIDQFMEYVSVSKQARDILWGTTVTETSLSVPSSLRSWIRADMTQISSRKFYDGFLSELDSVMQQGSPFTTGKSNEHDMFKWTSDIIVKASTKSFFGAALFEKSPGLVDDFRTFNRQTWKLLYKYPRFLSGSAYDSRDAAIDALERYFEMPQDQRRDAAPFVIKAEDEMRKHGISNRDIAAVLFKLYWAINGNPSILAFWLLARTLYTPHLKEDIKREVAPAFKKAIHHQPDVEYLKRCSKLNAAYYETMRLHSGSSSFRRVAQDTTIAGCWLKAGNDVMMPYRQLHLNKEYWGENAQDFDINRFVNNPKLHSAKTYKPFGGDHAEPEKIPLLTRPLLNFSNDYA